jgi:hypothetical protein
MIHGSRSTCNVKFIHAQCTWRDSQAQNALCCFCAKEGESKRWCPARGWWLTIIRNQRALSAHAAALRALKGEPSGCSLWCARQGKVKSLPERRHLQAEPCNLQMRTCENQHERAPGCCTSWALGYKGLFPQHVQAGNTGSSTIPNLIGILSAALLWLNTYYP